MKFYEFIFLIALDSVVTICKIMRLSCLHQHLTIPRWNNSPTAATTSPTINDTWLKTTYLNAKAAEAAKQWITGNSSMPFSGYCVPVHPGETYRPITVAEATPTDVSFVGATKVFGRNWCSSSQEKKTWNGWWWMPLISRFILMQQEPKAAVKGWAV